MSLLWRTAANLLAETHEQHAMDPVLRDAGWKESPCGWAGCPHFDEGFFDAMERGYDTRGQTVTKWPGEMQYSGMETTIDPHTVARYQDHPPHKKAVPKVVTYQGANHVLDGHHRLLADQRAGRPSTFEHVDLDGGQ